MQIETKQGLWVSSSFTEKFGNKDITPAKTVPAFRKLERNMYYSEIQKKLGVQECTLEDVAAFLENPPEGCDDDYADLFYVAGCVVYVDWYGVGREWSVNAWGLDGDYRRAGVRAFSRNSPSEPLASSGSLTLSPDVVALEQRIGALEEWKAKLIAALRQADV